MNKFTKKSYRRRKIVAGLALFISFGLISTGFAAWAIASSVQKEGSGNANAGTISEHSMELTLNETELGTLSFQPHHEDTRGRLKYQPEENLPADYENLVLSISGTITNIDFLDTLTVRFVEYDSSGKVEKTKEESGLYQASTKGYIKTPDCFYADINLRLVKGAFTELDNNTASFKYDITFEWGDMFCNVNPSFYYDGVINKDDTPIEDEAKRQEALAISEDDMKEVLVDLRNTIYGTDETLNEQLEKKDLGPQYKVFVIATAK